MGAAGEDPGCPWLYGDWPTLFLGGSPLSPKPLEPRSLPPWTPQGPGRPLTPSPSLRSVHPSKVSDSEKSQLVNETLWQYYGTPGSAGNLSLTWNAAALPSSAVHIELWGYEETGEPPPPLQEEEGVPGVGGPQGGRCGPGRGLRAEGTVWWGPGGDAWFPGNRKAAAPSSLSPPSGPELGQ